MNTCCACCVFIRGAAEPQKLRGVCVYRGGGAEEPGEPSAEQEQRAGAAEQRPQQRPRPADPPGKEHHSDRSNYFAGTACKMSCIWRVKHSLINTMDD